MFYVYLGTETKVDSSKIRDNLIERTDGQDGWSAVYANESSTADVGGLEIIGNKNMQYGIAAAKLSIAFVTSSIISNNTGLVEVSDTISIMTMFAAIKVLNGGRINTCMKGSKCPYICERQFLHFSQHYHSSEQRKFLDKLTMHQYFRGNQRQHYTDMYICDAIW